MLFILCQNTFEIIQSQLTVYVIINRHDRGKAAGTDATAGFQRELAIIRTTAVFDTQNILKLAENLTGALYITGSSQTDRDIIFALGTK